MYASKASHNMELRSRRLSCLVYLADSVILEVNVDSKDEGAEILNQVCSKLGIVEVDYFGLLQYGCKGEELWLNLRNRVNRELAGSTPHRLYFKVKFFVQPHFALQPSTRSQFYLNVKQDFLTGRLRVGSTNQTIELASLIAQAELGNQSKEMTGDRLNDYAEFLPPGDRLGAPEMLRLVGERHALLGGLDGERSRSRVLKMAAGLELYAMQYYRVTDDTGEKVNVGVGPENVVLFDDQWNITNRIQYTAIQTATHNNRTLLLQTVSDCGAPLLFSFQLHSNIAASALYRAMTEVYSFYRCDTVGSNVTTQFCRDLKGTLASLFNENTDLGKSYVFDVQRTLCEAYDHARRILYVRETPLASTNPLPGAVIDLETRGDDLETSMLMSAPQACDGCQCQVMKEMVHHLQDAFACCVCADCDINSVFIPCGHVMTCLNCAQQLDTCPLCKALVKNVYQIYLPFIKPTVS